MINTIIQNIYSVVWSPLTVFLIFGFHVYATIRTHCIQRKLFTAIKLSFSRHAEGEGEISPFTSLCSSLSATIGPGNIVGVTSAIITGGPGAVLWLWIAGFFGMATKYMECFLGVRYRVKTNTGGYIGGPMISWIRAFQDKGYIFKRVALVMSLFYCWACIAAAPISLAPLLTQQIVGSVQYACPQIPGIVIGVVLAALFMLLSMKGIKIIGKACEMIVPFMIVAYVSCCIFVLVLYSDYVLLALQTIAECAFTSNAILGGAVGYGFKSAITFGFSRAAYSNGAGDGTSSIMSSAANSCNPSTQGLINMSSVFWDTMFVGAFTGVTVVTFLLANSASFTGQELESISLVFQTFESVPVFGPALLVFALTLFSFSTLLAWPIYSQRCIRHQFGYKKEKRGQIAVSILIVLVTIMIVVSSEFYSDSLWLLGDIAEPLLMITNIILVILTSKTIWKETRYFVYKKNLDCQVVYETPSYQEAVQDAIQDAKIDHVFEKHAKKKKAK